jgi:hypothetical protein
MLSAICVGRSSVGPCPGQCPAVTLRPIASPAARSRSIGSNPDGLSGAEGKTPTVRLVTRRAGSSSSPWPTRDRVARRGASRGPARRSRLVAPLPCDDQPPTRRSPPTRGRPPASTGHPARSRLPAWSRAAAAAQQTVGDRPVRPRAAPARRPASRPEAGSAPRPRPGQCPTRAVVEATRHPRRQQPPRPAQRPDAKPDRPGQRLRGVSIHTLPAHSLSCCPRHAPPSSQKRRQTARATRICGKPVVLRSPRHRPESWRSQLGARSATPHCIPVSPHAFWSIRRTSRLAVVNALQDQLGMRSGQVETGWTSVDVGWVSTSAEGSAASAPF